jgi:hypothetical protein
MAQTISIASRKECVGESVVQHTSSSPAATALTRTTEALIQILSTSSTQAA